MPSMTWTPYTGADLLQGPLRDRRGRLFPTPLSGTHQAAVRGLHLRGPDAHAERLLLGVEAYDASDVLLATSASSNSRSTTPGPGFVDYLAPARCLPLDPCAAEADTPTLSWNAVPNAGWYEVTVANDASVHEPDPEVRDGVHRPDASGVVRRQPVRPGLLLVRPAVRGRQSLPVRSRSDERPRQQQRVCLQEDLVRGGAGDAGRLGNGCQPGDVHLDRLPRHQRGPRGPRSPGGQDLQDRGLARGRLLLDLRHGDGRPDDLHAVQQDLSGRPALLARPGDRRQRQHADEEPGADLNKVSPKVVPTFPTNGSTQSGVPFFQWTPQAYAATYLVEIYKNGDTSSRPRTRF